MASVPVRRSTRLSNNRESYSVKPLARRPSRQSRTIPIIDILSIDDDDKDQVLNFRSKTPMKLESPNEDSTTPIKQKSSPRKTPSVTPTQDMELLSLTSPQIAEPQESKATKSLFKEPRTPHKQKSSDIHEKDCHVTPPKQRKIGNVENTPNTPLTPSTLLNRLSLDNEEGTNNRRSLFKENDVYQNARKALHSTFPTNMPGRDKELEELRDFITGHLKDGTSGTLYISGPPGTGKTASLNLILQEKQIASEVTHIYINCTTIKSSGAIFSRIANDLRIKVHGKSEKDYANAIEKYLNKNHRTLLLVLDEIDQLESRKQSVLYTIFEWPAHPDSKLILIGIANALDLTDRILPRLQARCELKPTLMHFASYTKQQIIEIFTSRLKDAGVLEIFSPVALQMLAGKVAAVSGDLRRALDIGRRVVEMVDRKSNRIDVLKSVENLASEIDDGSDVKLEAVDLKQVVNVLNTVYGASQNLAEDVDETFPLQQKIVICTLILILKKARNKDVTVGKLHDVYKRVCGRRNIQAIDQSEFVGLCSLIETRGIIKIICKKDPRLNKVSLMWDEGEVVAVLKDKQLMSDILQDVSCLGKL